MKTSTYMKALAELASRLDDSAPKTAPKKTTKSAKKSAPKTTKKSAPTTKKTTKSAPKSTPKVAEVTKPSTVDETLATLERGCKELLTSDRYRRYLDTMSKFYRYSANNCLLIAMQCPDASYVAGFNAWKDKFGRYVKRGSKAIKILAPCPHKRTEVNEDGEEEVITYTTYKAVSVFDVSQTDGKPLPTICNTLTDDVENYTRTLEKLKALSPVDISFKAIRKANGYYSPKDNKIVIKSGMSQSQTIKTTVHEIAHALLHGKDGEQKDAHRGMKEVQAESVAYTVCKALGIDSSEYTFGYVTGWADMELKDLQKSLSVIQKTACKILTELAA